MSERTDELWELAAVIGLLVVGLVQWAARGFRLGP